MLRLLVLFWASTVNAMQHQLSLPESSVQEVPRVEMNAAHNNADVARRVRRAVCHAEDVPERSIVDVAATITHVEPKGTQAALLHNDTMDLHIAHRDATVVSFVEPHNSRGESSVVCTTCQGKAGEKLDAGLATVGIKFRADNGSAIKAATAVQAKANHVAGKAVKITAHATTTEKDKANAPAQVVKNGANAVGDTHIVEASATVAGNAFQGKVTKPLALKLPLVSTPVKNHTLAPLPSTVAEATKNMPDIVAWSTTQTQETTLAPVTQKTMPDATVRIATLGGRPEPIGTATRAVVSFRAKQPVMGPTDESHRLLEKLSASFIEVMEARWQTRHLRHQQKQKQGHRHHMHHPTHHDAATKAAKTQGRSRHGTGKTLDGLGKCGEVATGLAKDANAKDCAAFKAGAPTEVVQHALKCCERATASTGPNVVSDECTEFNFKIKSKLVAVSKGTSVNAEYPGEPGAAAKFKTGARLSRCTTTKEMMLLLYVRREREREREREEKKEREKERERE